VNSGKHPKTALVDVKGAPSCCIPAATAHAVPGLPSVPHPVLWKHLGAMEQACSHARKTPSAASRTNLRPGRKRMEGCFRLVWERAPQKDLRPWLAVTIVETE